MNFKRCLFTAWAVTTVVLGVANPQSLVALPRVAQAPKPLEHYLSEGKAAEYVPLAKAYLESKPTGPQASQIAWNLFLAASTLDDVQETRSARLRLCADFSMSLSTQYLLKRTSAKEHAKFLKACFKNCDLQAEPQRLDRFYRATEAGFERFGPKFGGNELILFAALVCPKRERATQLIEEIQQPGQEGNWIFDIARDDKLSGLEKYRKLDVYPPSEEAIAYQWILFQTQLKPDEQSVLEMATPLFNRLMEDEEPALAARVFRPVCLRYDNPRLLFELAYAEAIAGQGAEAAATLRQLRKQSEETWGETADRLIPVFENLDKNTAEQSRILGKVAETIQRSPPEVIELKLQGHDDQIGDFLAYAAIHVADEGLEFIVQNGGQTICAFKTSSSDNKSFFLKEASIRRFGERAYPVPEYSFSRNDDGKPFTSLGLAMKTNGKGRFRYACERFVSSPQIVSKLWRERFLALDRANGFFPAEVRSTSEGQVLRWIHLSREKAEVQSIELLVTQDFRLTRVDAKELGSLQIRYGSVRDTKLSPPAWPNSPTIEIPEFGTDELARLMSSALELGEALFNDDDEAAIGKKGGGERR